MRAARFTYPSFFIGIFLTFFLFHFTFLTKNYRNSTEDVIVKITKGDNLRTVADKLEESQVIFNKYVFIGLGRIFSYQDNLIPGEYKFSEGLTYLNILKMISDPFVVRTVTVTIPEGLTIRQMGRLLQRQIGIDSARFVEEAKNDSLIGLLGLDPKDSNIVNLEGFLFPDTYRFPLSGNMNREREIVSVLAAEFRKKITPEIREKMTERNLTLIQLITMASIVEGETRYEPEKKIIAGAYYNRLKKNMRLEADPTVQYSLPEPKKRLMYSDLKYPSPYNTYLNKGLPPGPINNPGLGSILAALDPERHNYIFFVAKGDGSHRFAVTYDEHKQNIQLYQKFLKEKEEQKEKDKDQKQ
jgi:UPF0755 protein